MAPQTLGTCATCNSPTALRCAGCKDAPDYERGDAADTFYCGKACQLNAREAHKKTCRNMSGRLTDTRVLIVSRSLSNIEHALKHNDYSTEYDLLTSEQT